MLGNLLAAAIIFSHYAAAQTAECTNSEFQWTFNSLNQSPCLVAQSLGSACTSGQPFPIDALPENQVYTGPTAENANECRCNSVYYSMLSACATCQTRSYIKWSSYSKNCSLQTVLQKFPPGLPNGTVVPDYAYLDVTVNDAFNITLAQNDHGPESTGVPQPTSTSSSTKGSSSSKAGPIAGGVVGGLAFVALVAGGAFWWTRRRRMATPSSPSSDLVPVTLNHNGTIAAPSYTAEAYRPSYSRTYPSMSDVNTMVNSPQGNATAPTNVGRMGGYTGAAEI